jgi:hypothetical protein
MVRVIGSLPPCCGKKPHDPPTPLGHRLRPTEDRRNPPPEELAAAFSCLSQLQRQLAKALVSCLQA